MGKHSKKQHYRRIVIATVVLGAVGVPSAAMACTDWPGGGEGRISGAGTLAAHDADGSPQWDEDAHTPVSVPTVSTIATKPKHHKHHHKHQHVVRKHTERQHTEPQRTPTASHSPAPSTPKATPSATSTPSAPATPKASPAAPNASPAPAAPSAPKPATTASSVAAQVVQLVNAERSKAGCSPVTLNAALTKAAQAHSEDMAAHKNMSHTGSDGSDPGSRISGVGYDWSTYGENVAYGYSTPAQVMAGWMSSQGHKENILNCSFKEIGVGLAQPGDYWTQDFGTAF
jgi:uncharacterized protein YkwD